MKKTLLIIICMALLVLPLLPFISAEDSTTIVAKSGIAYNVSVTISILDPNSMTYITGFDGYSNNQPEIDYNFTSDHRTFTLLVMIQSHGTIITNKNYGNYTTGGTINIDLFETTSTTGTASTTSNTSATTTNQSSTTTVNLSNSSNISGNVISSEDNSTVAQANSSSFTNLGPTFKKIGLWAAYIVGGIIILIIIYFVIRFIIKAIRNMSSKRSRGEDIQIAPNPRIEKELANAQRKIKEAQDTIDNITNRKRRLTEAERKFEEAKRELDRLKKD